VTLPRRSLGWELGPWIERHLGITLTNEQTARLVRLYELDEVGARVVRRAGILRPKGVGKSPEGGYLALAELAGPVVFDGWRSNGRPRGIPHPSPVVQIAALSEDQTANVMLWLFDILADRPASVSELGLDLGKTRITRRLRNREGTAGILEPITAAAGSKEGARMTFGVLDQTESWTKENGGVRLAETMRRNAGKVGGWSIELMNAPELGDQSVADRTISAAEKETKGVYFERGPEAPEVPDLSDRPRLRESLAVAYGDASKDRGGWVDLDRLVDEINDPDTDPADARRFFLNQRVPKSERAFDRRRWIEGSKTRTRIAPGSFIAAGFDGSLFHDATALVIVEVESGTFELAGLWEKPENAGDEWQVPVEEVDGRVAELVEGYEMALLLADPHRWGTSIAAWNDLRRRQPFAFSFDTSKWRQVGYACKGLATEIRAGDVGSAPDEPDLLRHMSNAVRRYVNARDEQNRPLWTLAKPAPALKIDAAMATVLAGEARRRAIAGGMKPRRRVRAAGF
jgi:hypothetical protein